MFSKSYLILFTFVEWVYAQESPKVNPFTSSIKPVVGGKTSLSCQSLFGSPPLEISWLKDGKEISDSNSIKIKTIDESSILIIDSITSSHSGNYSCIISNRYGQDSYSTQLIIEGPPQWLIKPEDIKAKVGEKLSINCVASGYPIPMSQWKVHQGNDWIGIEQSRLSDLKVTGNQLIITKTNRQHAGKFGCSVSDLFHFLA